MLAVKDGWRGVCEKKNLIPVSNVFLNNSLENLLHVLVIDAKDYIGRAGGVSPSLQLNRPSHLFVTNEKLCDCIFDSVHTDGTR